MSAKRACLALLLASWLPLPANAGLSKLTDLYVFGDSLSDGGNSGLLTKTAFPPQGYPPLPYVGGRLSNGPVAVEYLWDHFNPDNTDFRPSLAGGTNYALFGSTTGLESAIDVNDSIPLALKPLYQKKSLAWQLNEFQKDAAGESFSFDPDHSLFVTWLFPNDVYYWLGTIAQGQGMTPGTALGEAGVNVDPSLAGGGLIIGNGINNILTSISQQAFLGANNFLIPNMPNIADTPFITEMNDTEISALAGAISAGFNTGLEAALDQFSKDFPLELNIVQFQTDDLFEDIQEDPAAYGLLNATDSCFDAAALTICDNPEDYLFWDGNHPTTAGHRILAAQFHDAVRHKVPAPLPVLGSLVAFRWSRKLRKRMQLQPER